VRQRCRDFTNGSRKCEVSVPVSQIGFGRYVSQSGLSGLAVGLGQGSEFLGPVVSGTMRA
jgi:hypothetical protein